MIESKSVLLKKVLGLEWQGSASGITALEHILQTREDGQSGR